MNGKQHLSASKSTSSNGTHKNPASRGSAKKNFEYGNKHVPKNIPHALVFWKYGFDEILKKNDYPKLLIALNTCNNIIVGNFKHELIHLPENNALLNLLFSDIDNVLSEKTTSPKKEIKDNCRWICVLTLLFLYKGVSKYYQNKKQFSESVTELSKAMQCCYRLKNVNNVDWYLLCTSTLLVTVDVFIENAKEDPSVAYEKLRLSLNHLDVIQKYFSQALKLLNDQEGIDSLLNEGHAVVAKRIEVMLIQKTLLDPSHILNYCNLVKDACKDSYATVGKHLGTPENIRNTVSKAILLIETEITTIPEDHEKYQQYRALWERLYQLQIDIAFLANNQTWLDEGFSTLLEKSIEPSPENCALRESMYAKIAVANHDLVAAEQHYQAALVIYRSLKDHSLAIQSISSIILCGIRDCNEESIINYMDEVELHFRQQFLKFKLIDKTLKRDYKLITSLIDISQSFLWSLYVAAKNSESKESYIQATSKTHETLRLVSQIIEKHALRTEVELLSSVAINLVHSKESKLMKIAIERQKETSTENPTELMLPDQTELSSEPISDPIPEEELNITRSLKKQYRDIQPLRAAIYPYLQHCEKAFNEFYQYRYDAALHHLDICEGMTASRSENFSECCMIDCSILRAYININLTSHTRSLEKELRHVGTAILHLQNAINFAEKLPNYTPKQIVFFAKDPIALRLYVIEESINLLTFFVENAADFMNHLIKITDEEKKSLMESDPSEEILIDEDSNYDLEFVKQKIEFYTILQSTCSTLQSDLNEQKNRFTIIRQQLNQSISDPTLLLEFKTFTDHTQ